MQVAVREALGVQPVQRAAREHLASAAGVSASEPSTQCTRVRLAEPCALLHPGVQGGVRSSGCAPRSSALRVMGARKSTRPGPAGATARSAGRGRRRAEARPGLLARRSGTGRPGGGSPPRARTRAPSVFSRPGAAVDRHADHAAAEQAEPEAGDQQQLAAMRARRRGGPQREHAEDQEESAIEARASTVPALGLVMSGEKPTQSITCRGYVSPDDAKATVRTPIELPSPRARSCHLPYRRRAGQRVRGRRARRARSPAYPAPPVLETPPSSCAASCR